MAKLRYKQAIKEAILTAEEEFNDDLVDFLCKNIAKAFGRPGEKSFALEI